VGNRSNIPRKSLFSATKETEITCKDMHVPLARRERRRRPVERSSKRLSLLVSTEVQFVGGGFAS
jgi:hypothetical protein